MTETEIPETNDDAELEPETDGEPEGDEQDAGEPVKNDEVDTEDEQES